LTIGGFVVSDVPHDAEGYHPACRCAHHAVAGGGGDNELWRCRGPAGQSCGTEITTNCRGVNFDANRLKECLSRNQDVLTPQCKSSYFGVFDAIQKRIAARVTVANACAREIVKLCGGSTKETSKAVPCVVAAKNAYKGCTNAITDAGYQ